MAFSSQMMETLQERFDHMRIKGRGQLYRFELPTVILNWPTLMFPCTTVQFHLQQLSQLDLRLLVHFFKAGLDHELLHMCVYQGVPDQIHEWYWMVVVMDLELKWYKKCRATEQKPKTQPEKHQLGK